MRRLCCLGSRAAAAAAALAAAATTTTETEVVTAAGVDAAPWSSSRVRGCSQCCGEAGRARRRQLRHGECGRPRAAGSGVSLSPLGGGVTGPACPGPPGRARVPVVAERLWTRSGTSGLRTPRFPFWGASSLGTVLLRIWTEPGTPGRNLDSLMSSASRREDLRRRDPEHPRGTGWQFRESG